MVTMYSLLLLVVVVVANEPVYEDYYWEELSSAEIDSQITLPHQIATRRQLPSITTRRHDQFPQDPTCPYPYTLVLDECIYLSTHTVTWEAGRRHCKGMMGDLATPKYLYAIRSFLLDVAKVEGGNNIAANVGFRKESNSTFQWLDGRLVNAADFGAGEPNNIGGNEFCGEFRLDVDPMLNDISCSFLNRFLCQYHPPN
ncbi:macrophage mannose receptor 1-like [Procambarus clarkii]|uniref:macrophage mannose receptor 1-like n=1 Tax=Procambarus clarkii TaxID=6728 RepID=UPI001E67750A|nr:macrophage mannose receptor 1-like [Procambarus clarkii]